MTKRSCPICDKPWEVFECSGDGFTWQELGPACDCDDRDPLPVGEPVDHGEET